ncbi:alpha-N-acetylglucosaminidase [Actinacidiphila yanglinensis]|uniref:Alpha-N-acetylglucosaminidase n=1 Tax=Actinacidiphila yanglinensis TaxID=310779 RepID=A0A1H6B551_9ACTN|nr:alpha-N-acetylglucosaminidase TIM-barrel domain-containing protein [Actinacidiphila yanglinensis]SEG55327.1 alpha-N-acetylglucosaminidase [Actinacidiphila yanglinensis]
MTGGVRRPWRRALAALSVLAATAALVAVPGTALAGTAPAVRSATTTTPTTHATTTTSTAGIPAPAAAMEPAHDALVRLVGAAHARQVDLRQLPGGGADRYQVQAEDGRLTVSGTTPATALRGFGVYLHDVVHADFSLNGDQAHLPAVLPLPKDPIAGDAAVAHRFALNDTNEGYSGPYLAWGQWQHRIDVLALDGINEVLVYEGQEAVYEQAFEQFGYTAAEMRAWIPQPGHQSWWMLQNLCCLGGPVPQQLIDTRVALARQITSRLRALGMTPVLPGYYGTVPPDFAQKNPGAHTIAQGTWNHLQRPDWLDPTGQDFAAVAAEFYQVQTRLFGSSSMYKMDLLHEGGQAGDVNIPDASRAVQDALEKAHPDAIWAILGWENNPLQATLTAVDKSRMLVVDGNSDQPSTTDRDHDFDGVPYAFGTIWNFGGHTNLGTSLTTWNTKFHQWLARPGTALNGIAMMPEAIDNNPAAVEFFAGLAWEPAAVDVHQWFTDYATARYGGQDPNADAAWRILADTVYAWPPTNDTKHVTGVYELQPSLTATGGTVNYDPAQLRLALSDLLAVRPSLRTSTAYRYDVVDLARQVLANDGRTLLPQIRAAYAARDRALFEQLTGTFTGEIQLLDRLLGSDSNFLFGAWQAEAAAQAGSPAEAAALEYDARSLLTQWSATGVIQDYAAREWNGLVGDYYLPRWQTYFSGLDQALRTGTPAPAVDWIAVATQWDAKTTRYRSAPAGDAHALAEQVAAVPAGGLSLNAETPGAKPGGTVRVTATFTDRNPVRAARQPSFTLTAPAGYRVTPVASPPPGDISPNGTASRSWDVTVPRDAAPTTVVPLSGRVTWTSGSARGAATAAAGAVVAGTVSAPYRTASTTPVTVARNGSTLSLAGGGADQYVGSNEYGTIYRPQLLADGTSVTTQVLAQGDSGPYARAGLVIASDLGTPGSGGYATLAVTPAHGCMLSWDSDGDGRLDHYAEDDGFSAPAHLRLSRTGDTITGACSIDGTNWAVVGSATVPGMSAVEDAGVDFSAVDRDTHLGGYAVFRDLAVGAYTPRDTTGDPVVSVGQPATALSSEAGSPPSAADDGDRTNKQYWGGVIGADNTWWQVDLGSDRQLSSVNVRTYVDGKRYYTYRLEGSTDGTHWFTLGGKLGTAPATDAGDTYGMDARARYVRVVGLSNSANGTFHLSEVTVRAAAG